MEEKELKALISLLDDEDQEIINHVEGRIFEIGPSLIDPLGELYHEIFEPATQNRIENIIHKLQIEQLQNKLIDWKNNGGKDLLEGMILIATYQYPDIDPLQIQQEIEQIYFDIWIQFKEDLHFFDQIKIINEVLFKQLRFSGNTKNFFSPSNNMINAVLQTKKGNPVTLCALYLILAQKLNLTIYGINLPNFFILTYKNKDQQFYINVFNRGLIFTKEEIDKYIVEMHLSPQDSFYQPCTNLKIIQRLLNNLVYSFEKLGDHEKSEELKSLLRLMN